jgi:hypothetical protein
MSEAIRYRGKVFGPKEIDEIKEVIAAHRDQSRWFISRELCRRWGWTQPNGVLKDIICRGLLLRLEAQGLIELPPRGKISPYHLSPHKQPAQVQVDQAPMEGKLSDLKPIELLQVRWTPLEKLYNSLIEQYHSISLFRIHSTRRRASGVSCPGPGASRCLFGVVFCSSSHWVSGSLFRVEPRAAAKESLSHRYQYKISYFAMGQGSSFSLSPFRIDGSKDSTGLARDLSS